MTFLDLATSKRAQAASALAIVLAAVLAWERSDDGKLNIMESAEQEVADNYSSNVSALQFSTSGELQYHLHTAQAAHYLSSDESILTRPILLSYGEQGTIWRTVSDFGKVRSGGDIVDLWGNVSMQRNDDGARIASDNVSIDTLAGEASTKAAVTLTTPASRLEGQGMRANINSETVKLLENVRGIYESATR